MRVAARGTPFLYLSACVVLVGFHAHQATGQTGRYVNANPPAASSQVGFSWATVGDPGNPGDTRIGIDGSSGYGAVPYLYQISKYDVTNSQYSAFLNAVDPSGTNSLGVYNSRMSSFPGSGTPYTGGIDLTSNAVNGSKYTPKPGEEDFPVVYVSWNSAARFINWLANGQGGAGTESGTYDMSQPVPVRAQGAGYALPSEDEWYKAAYYDPTKNGTGGYYLYATRSDDLPTADVLGGNPNAANYYNLVFAKTGSPVMDPNQSYISPVGAYFNASSYYGTFDQTGDVIQWTESLRYQDPSVFGYYRVTRGGSWQSSFDSIGANFRGKTNPNNVSNFVGFRVVAIPEPTIGALVAAVGGLALLRRRRHAPL